MIIQVIVISIMFSNFRVFVLRKRPESEWRQDKNEYRHPEKESERKAKRRLNWSQEASRNSLG